jgi:hypothetical protein
MAYRGKYPHRIAQVSYWGKSEAGVLVVVDNVGNRVRITGIQRQRLVAGLGYKAPELGQDIRSITFIMARMGLHNEA